MFAQVIRGRKTMTRRIESSLDKINKHPDNWSWDERSENGYLFSYKLNRILCKPRYKVGETVFIKESHYINGETILYRADQLSPLYSPDIMIENGGKWSNAMFCGEKAARHYIRIKSVEVERLQDITREDAAAEGCCFDVGKPKWVQDHWFPEKNFATLIDIINGKHTYQKNPWCFVYQFELSTNTENKPIPSLSDIFPSHS